MTHPSKIKTIGDLRRAREAAPDAFARRPVKNEVRDNLIKKLAAGESLFRHHRLRRHGDSPAGERDFVASQLHPARTARAGEEPYSARARVAARRASPGPGRL